ncbi:bud site selection protein 14 [[Candida] railenensis]|uniref:Bud site selection protein 14 n=1 Tax=[Candida] railenensis TaxID=45579 RepID=A0A9P0QTL2_9ASCO|nr:bud site selection protein 14 [[Candida] railenensis]
MDKLEPDLRKLSVTSSTSTQHSQASSVIINRNLSGLGKSNVDSVLSYISQVANGNDEINTEGIYEERRRINRSASPEVNSSSSKRNSKSPSPQVTQMLTQSRSEPQRLTFKGITQMEFSDSESPSRESHGYYDEYDYGSDNGYEHDDESEGDFEEEDTYIDEEEDVHASGHAYGGEQFDEDDDFIPPSPPRSPPREIDPDKLYGLYDFSGPDPSHCTLSRDEPVYLLNDEDNYWWLIQKLTKQEKVNEVSDDEDGKIGFVPAECLETYGERLARLNCFKNEELEKQENSNEDEVQIISGTKLKSVTFEQIGDVSVEKVVINVDSEDEGSIEGSSKSDIRQKNTPAQVFPHEIFSIPAGSLGLAPPIVEKQGSEVLSDIFPEVPLVVAKNSKKSNATAKATDVNANNIPRESLQDVESSPFSYKTITPNSTPTIQQSQYMSSIPQLAPPQMKSNDMDSIGSYSPDTPPGQQDSPNYSSPRESNENGGSSVRAIRRSVILERLNQVTSDIQESFNIQDDLNYSDMEKIMFGIESSRDDLSIYASNGGDQLSQRESSEISLARISSSNNDGNNNEKINDNIDDNSRQIPSDYNKNRQSSDLDDDCVGTSNDTFTPSTSTASLVEKGTKEKSIHDMFVPILGKFDELAERLEELNGILR